MTTTPALTALPGNDTPRVLVRGLANSGKTSAALAHVAELVACGASPASILYVAASPTAAADVRAALAARDLRLADVTVTTAPAFELALLDCPEAFAVTGRRARVLTEFEYGLLMEDLRAENIPTKNLKGMIGFFQRSWTELADDDLGAFVVDPREVITIEAIERYLRAYEACIAAEVSKQCVRYLRVCSTPAPAAGIAHVVLDDYTSLNCASQIALEMLAPQTLWAFADPADAPRGADPFPYLKGVEEFVERNAGAVVVDLPAPAPADARGAAAWLATCGFTEALSLGLRESRGVRAVEETYDVPSAPAPLANVACDVCKTPQEELAGVAESVAALLAEGVAPTQVLVAVPNRNWARGVSAALKQRGVASQVLGARQEVQGDVRNFDSCGSVRMYAALGLLADASDPLSWRAWCAFGDPGARSALFSPLVTAAAREGLGLRDAIDRAAAGQLEGMPGVLGIAEVREQGLLMLEALAGLRGTQLLAELAGGLGLDGVPRVFARARALAGEDASAAQLFAAVQRLVLAPELAGDEAGVRVVEYSKVTGLKAEHVLVAGFMNGWLPRHAYFDAAEATFAERQRMDAEGRHATYNLAGCCTADLRFSGFSTCDLESAEKMKLKGYRVSMGADGRRVTTCKPSVLLDYALDAWALKAREA